MIFGKRKASGRMLLIHIGDHKTGSTTIQNAFAKSCIQIEGETPCYPNRLNHNFLPSALYDRYKGKGLKTDARSRAILTKLGQNLKAASTKYSLISGEMLERTPPAQLKRFIDDYTGSAFDEVKVISYVRPHAERLLSGYAEVTKIGGNQKSLQAFCDNMAKGDRLLYAKRFQAWRDAFGDQFILRPMIPSALTNESLLDDFIIHGFGTENFEITPFDDDNKSLSLQDLMLLKALQSRISDQPKTTRHTFGREVARHLGHQPSTANDEKLRMHVELAQSIAEHYAEDAHTVDTAFFGGEPLLENALDVAIKKASPSVTSTDPADHFPASELRRIHALGDLFNMMISATDTDWSKIFRTARIDALHKN
ncbi:hypothetical protein ALP8811_02627 [Aliiroseovarius pelagivivens]|uniref:Sulfotransferase domain-containing protein n=1 Tax=Aliiroseovarius pelagivivens TaxID=1639690 RepID=A0A2R8AS61_9RHOB|nr:hypothetical protein [Aliiroseovarius pelagivivens]SPF78697.1 hypothetical protein ALP8811_02627 [Aliiroseovarius pelagivivens]